MVDLEWKALNDEIVSEGYEYEGGVMLPSDSDEDGVSCPNCDEGGYWTVVYHHSTRPDDFECANLCYDCGHIWRDGGHNDVK